MMLLHCLKAPVYGCNGIGHLWQYCMVADSNAGACWSQLLPHTPYSPLSSSLPHLLTVDGHAAAVILENASLCLPCVMLMGLACRLLCCYALHQYLTWQDSSGTASNQRLLGQARSDIVW